MLISTAQKIKELKEIINKQHHLIEKQDKYIKLLEDKAYKLEEINIQLQHDNVYLRALTCPAEDINFPNTEKGGQAGQERPTIFPDDSNLF